MLHAWEFASSQKNLVAGNCTFANFASAGQASRPAHLQLLPRSCLFSPASCAPDSGCGWHVHTCHGCNPGNVVCSCCRQRCQHVGVCTAEPWRICAAGRQGCWRPSSHHVAFGLASIIQLHAEPSAACSAVCAASHWADVNAIPGLRLPLKDGAGKCSQLLLAGPPPSLRGSAFTTCLCHRCHRCANWHFSPLCVERWCSCKPARQPQIV
jgi:hypothetical protein